MDIDDLIADFERLLSRGTAAYQRQENVAAREDLALACERLYQIASATSYPRLREARIDRAQELLELVESLFSLRAVHSAPRSGEPESGGGVVAVATPDLKLNDVAGMDEVKALVRQKMIDPFLFPEMAAALNLKLGGGILLYGPPGTGKTLLARAVAGELQAAFYYVLASDIMSKWVGEPEKNVRSLFDQARRHPRAIVFIDEIDGLAACRTGAEGYMRRVTNQLLAEMQSFDHHGGALLVAGATNHPELLDSAILRPGRFDELIYVPLPDIAARRAILHLDLDRRETDAGVDVDDLARRTQGYSGAELCYIAEKAAQRAFDRSRALGKTDPIQHADLLAALADRWPGTSEEDLQRLIDFGRRHSA